MSKQLLHSSAVVGAMTLVSRVSGFVRDLIIARLFGADPATDAFFVAFKIPNFLRRLFAEGAFSQAFVPVLSAHREARGEDELRRFLDRIAGTFALLLLVLTGAGVLAAPLLVSIFAPGFLWKGGHYAQAVEMLRVTFPYLFFISFAALAAGILNTYGRFAVPAFAPVFLNLSLIAAAFWLSPHLSEPIMALAYGVLAAGLLQLLFFIPPLLRLGLMPRLRVAFYEPEVRRIARLMVPAIVGVSVTQINLLVDTMVASFLTASSVSWLYYSERLVEFPLGIFGIALATAILPSLAKSHAVKRMETFSLSLDLALRWVVLIAVPAALGLCVLAELILTALFQNDEFTSNDVYQAGRSLRAYSAGLLGFVLVKVLAPGFTSRQDMRTPVRYGIVAMAANLVLNIALAIEWAHAGLAFATSLAAYINASLLFRRLRREKVYRPEPGWGAFILRVSAANAAMCGVLNIGTDAASWQRWSAWDQGGYLLVWIAAGFSVYCLVLWALGMRPRHLVQQSVE